MKMEFAEYYRAFETEDGFMLQTCQSGFYLDYRIRHSDDGTNRIYIEKSNDIGLTWSVDITLTYISTNYLCDGVIFDDNTGLVVVSDSGTRKVAKFSIASTSVSGYYTITDIDFVCFGQSQTNFVFLKEDHVSLKTYDGSEHAIQTLFGNYKFVRPFYYDSKYYALVSLDNGGNEEWHLKSFTPAGTVVDLGTLWTEAKTFDGRYDMIVRKNTSALIVSKTEGCWLLPDFINYPTTKYQLLPASVEPVVQLYSINDPYIVLTNQNWVYEFTNNCRLVLREKMPIVGSPCPMRWRMYGIDDDGIYYREYLNKRLITASTYTDEFTNDESLYTQEHLQGDKLTIQLTENPSGTLFFINDGEFMKVKSERQIIPVTPTTIVDNDFDDESIGDWKGITYM